MSTNTQEVSLIFPEGKEITVKKEAIKIMPFGFGKFPKLLALMKDFKEPAPGTEVNIKNIAVMIADNSEAVMELCMLATGKKREWLDDVPPDEAVILLRSIFEVNIDFFVKRLQPTILESIQKVQDSVGALSSQS